MSVAMIVISFSCIDSTLSVSLRLLLSQLHWNQIYPIDQLCVFVLEHLKLEASWTVRFSRLSYSSKRQEIGADWALRKIEMSEIKLSHLLTTILSM